MSRTRKRAQRLVGVIGILASAALLSSCTPPERMAARLTPSGVEFAVCRGMDYNGIRVMALERGESTHPYPTVWLVRGDGTLKDGDTIRFGEVPEGSTVAVPPEEFEFGGGQIFLRVEQRNPSGTLASSRFGSWYVDDLVAGQWQREDGEYYDEPCPGRNPPPTHR